MHLVLLWLNLNRSRSRLNSGIKKVLASLLLETKLDTVKSKLEQVDFHKQKQKN